MGAEDPPRHAVAWYSVKTECGVESMSLVFAELFAYNMYNHDTTIKLSNCQTVKPATVERNLKWHHPLYSIWEGRSSKPSP